MAYWLSRDDERHAPYELWTKRPTWSDKWGWWEAHYKNGKCDSRQPVDSYKAASFPAVSGIRLRPGELTRLTKFEVAVKRVVRKRKSE